MALINFAIFRLRVPLLWISAGTLLLLGCASQITAEDTTSLIELTSVNELKDRFNEDEGSTRLILLLSPT